MARLVDMQTDLRYFCRLDQILDKLTSCPGHRTKLVNSSVCPACLKEKQNFISNGTDFLCLDCFDLIPELHFAGNHNSSIPQGELSYEYGIIK